MHMKYLLCIYDDEIYVDEIYSCKCAQYSGGDFI